MSLSVRLHIFVTVYNTSIGRVGNLHAYLFVYCDRVHIIVVKLLNCAKFSTTLNLDLYNIWFASITLPSQVNHLYSKETQIVLFTIIMLHDAGARK